MITLNKVWYTTKQALLLYKSKIISYFDQGCIFYEGANSELLHGLQVLQNKCLRIIYPRRQWINMMEAHRMSNILKKIDVLCHLLNLVTRCPMIIAILCPTMWENFAQGGKYCWKFLGLRPLRSVRVFMLKSVKLWNSIPEELKKVLDASGLATRLKREMLQGNLNFPE